MYKARIPGSDKLDPGVVLYMTAKEIGDRTGACCASCMMFVRDHCTVIEGPIKGPTDVCGLYVHGKHSGPDMRGTISRKSSGYISSGAPTHCGNCEHYGGGNEKSGPCKIVSGTVEYHGCCNAWEPK